MATQPIDAPTPLYAILGTIPALPRPILRALATRIIDRLDEMDGDPDLEDDDPPGGNVEDEGEPETSDCESAWGADQRVMIFAHGRFSADYQGSFGA